MKKLIVIFGTLMAMCVAHAQSGSTATPPAGSEHGSSMDETTHTETTTQSAPKKTKTKHKKTSKKADGSKTTTEETTETHQ